MECSESNKREQIIKSYAQYVAQNPETSKEIIHIGLSAKIGNKYLNISIDELQKSPITTIPDEIVKKHILLKKYSLNHLIDPENNSNTTILFPNGSPLLYDNQPDVFVVQNQNEKYTLTNSIQNRKIQPDKDDAFFSSHLYHDKKGLVCNSNPISFNVFSIKKNNVTKHSPSFLFNKSSSNNEISITVNGFCDFKIYDSDYEVTYYLTTLNFYKDLEFKDSKKSTTEQAFHICVRRYSYLFITGGSVFTAFGIHKNSTFVLYSLIRKDKFYLQAANRSFAVFDNSTKYHEQWPPPPPNKTWYGNKMIYKNIMEEDRDRYEFSIPTPFTTIISITPTTWIGCTEKGEVYSIKIKNKNKSLSTSYNNPLINIIKLYTYKQKLPEGIRVKQIASNPLFPKELVFVAEKTENKNDKSETKIILYHICFDASLATEKNKYSFYEIEELNNMPDHIGFHKDYVTISNTYSETDTDKEKDFGIEVRNIPLTKRWLYLAGKLKNKKQT